VADGAVLLLGEDTLGLLVEGHRMVDHARQGACSVCTWESTSDTRMLDLERLD
jgi:hypothetical protein